MELSGHLRAAKDLKLLELDPVDGRFHLPQIPYRLNHLLAALAGKAQNDMDDDFNADLFQIADSPFKNLQRISPMDPLRRLLMDSLQAKLHPDRLLGLNRPKFPEHPQDLRGQTVRTCPDRQSGDLRPLQCLRIEPAQPFQLLRSSGIGIGKGLKIGNVFSIRQRNACRELGVHPLPCRPDLFLRRKERRRKFSRPAL